MSVCNFTIPITGDHEVVFSKARAAIEKQGGNFTGDEQSGQFDVTVIGNTIAGSYTSDGDNLFFIIDEKPFFISCDVVENFLKSKLV